MRVLTTFARVAFGFILACITAGLVTVLFVNTPAEVMALPASQLPETASETLDLALLTATHAALFAVAFVLIVAGLSEWMSIRALSYYVVAGVTIAMLGFAAQYSSEVTGQPTIFNNYALAAFLTTGFCAGFVYWLASGQFAGAPLEDAVVFRRDEQADVPVPNEVIAPMHVEDATADERDTAHWGRFRDVAKTRYGSLVGRLQKVDAREGGGEGSDEAPLVEHAASADEGDDTRGDGGRRGADVLRSATAGFSRFTETARRRGRAHYDSLTSKFKRSPAAAAEDELSSSPPEDSRAPSDEEVETVVVRRNGRPSEPRRPSADDEPDA